MPMLKPLAAAAVSAVAVTLATPVLAAPARAFECPATQAEATALLSQLEEVGAEVTDEYGFHTRTFRAEGFTVIGLPVFRLEVIASSEPQFDFMAFQAKTARSFEAAREAMFAATGRGACENGYEDITSVCKILDEPSDSLTITRYVEVSAETGINVGCQYTTRKG